MAEIKTDGGFPVQIGLVEPSEKLMKSDSAMLAKSFIRRQKRVPFRLIYTSATNKTTSIQQVTVEGKLHVIVPCQ